MKKAKLEIACFNLESASIAQANGADRVEWCANRSEGGTTPDYEKTKAVRKILSVELYVMIRPRGGNFVYSDFELEQMKLDIVAFKELKVNGFVFGILKADNSVNESQNATLVGLAKPLSCTFHRAFDVVENTEEALESVLKCGFKTILTSGQAQNCTGGMDALTALMQQAGKRIVIMPGGGLRSSTVKLLKEKTKASFYHSAAIIDSGEVANAAEIVALKINLGCS